MFYAVRMHPCKVWELLSHGRDQIRFPLHTLFVRHNCHRRNASCVETYEPSARRLRARSLANAKELFFRLPSGTRFRVTCRFLGNDMKIVARYCRVLLATVLLLVLGAAAQERRIQRSELPPAVQKVADEQSKGATVRGYSTEVENGKREYEVESTVNGHSRDVTIAPDGTVLEVEEQVEMAELPNPVRESLQSKAGSGKIT